MRKKKTIRRGRKGKHYFTEEHQEYILEYANTPEQRRRTELYIKHIQPVFNEMVDKIVYTYKFTNLPNIDDLKNECKIWLVTILDKFDPSKGSKAFSYFSVITKNWFIQKVKKNALQKKREVVYEDYFSLENESAFIVTNPYMELREQKEFLHVLHTKIQVWQVDTHKENEKRVLSAIEVLFSNSNAIEIFNKKAIYLYLREITGLNTKQIVSSLNKIRQKYKQFKIDWDNNEE